jgi:hypothetical protein
VTQEVSPLNHTSKHPKASVRDLLAKGALKEAADLFDQTIWNGGEPRDGSVLNDLSAILAKMADSRKQRSFLLQIVRQTPADRFVLIKLASLSFRDQDYEQARHYFDSARALGRLPDVSLSFQVDLAIALGQFRDAWRIAEEHFRICPDRHEVAGKLVLAASLAGQHERAAAVLRDSMMRWPRNWLLFARYNSLYLPENIDREIFEIVRQTTAKSDTESQWGHQLAKAHLRHGEVETAIALLRASDPHGLAARHANPLLRALENLPPPASTVPDRTIRDDLRSATGIVERRGAKATAVVFHGLKQAFGSIPYPLFDRFLARFPINIIYLHDRSPFAFALGATGLGSNREETVVALKNILDRMGGLPCITLGSSAGGRAAVEFGAALDAKVALSFAGYLAAVKDQSDAEARTAPGTTKYMLALLQAIVGRNISLVPLIAANPSMHVIHAVGAGSAYDTEAAEKLRHLSNVEVMTVPGCMVHNVAAHMMANGDFDGLVDRAITKASGSR